MTTENRSTLAYTTLLLTLGLVVGGCASSNQQTHTKSSSSATAQTEPADGPTRQIQKRVHFEEILGTALAGEKPSGCKGSWEPLEKSPYGGEAFFCSGFNGPEKWGEIPVTFAAQQGKLAVIAVQIFYDGGADEAKSEYEDFSGNLLDRCDRKTGFKRNIVLDCGDYFVEASWQSQYESAHLKVVYALNFEDLPK